MLKQIFGVLSRMLLKILLKNIFDLNLQIFADAHSAIAEPKFSGIIHIIFNTTSRQE